MVVAVLVIGLLTLFVKMSSQTDAIRQTQQTNTETSRVSQRTLDAIESCTTPGKPCYQNGQTQTAKAVGDINRVVVLAAACSVGLDPHLSVGDRQAVISSCVITRLARQSAQ